MEKTQILVKNDRISGTITTYDGSGKPSKAFSWYGRI